MKKTLLSATLVMGLLSMNSIQASNNITFNGKITSSTCTPTINGQTDGTVTLPTVSTNAFTGETAGRTQFNIDAKDCLGTVEKTVAAFFEPDAINIDPTTGLLNNVAPATPTPADNVKLQLLDGKNGNPIKVGYQDQSATGGTTFTAWDASGNATLIYYVEYKKAVAGNVVTAGPVVGKVVYNLMYK
ncbi:fimbrial protein [Kluyvera sp. STS39-E]|uniref:fimbrial protein n=1 Tax=Kluyvera sp. STS39-E TaxID=3234748 RepID=UPI0034C6175D